MGSLNIKSIRRFLLTPLPAKTYCLVVGVITGIGLSAVALLNYAVDPMAQFGTQIIPPVVQTSRAQKSARVAEKQDELNGLILGSSRVLKIEPDYLHELTGIRFYNAGVNHGHPEDWLAMSRFFYQRQGHWPSCVVLGVDVSSFEDNKPVDVRLISNRQLRLCVPEAISNWDIYGSLSSLVSFQQTKASLGSIKRLIRSGNSQPIEEFRDDGVIAYHQREQQMRDGVYDFEFAIDYNRREYRAIFSHYDRLSEQRIDWFETLLHVLTQNDCRVFLFLTPAHPELDNHLSDLQNYADRTMEVTNFLNHLADDPKITFANFHDVSSFGGDATQFVDGIHPLESNTRLMMDILLRPETSAPSVDRAKNGVRNAVQ